MTYKQTLDYLYAKLPMYHRVGAQAYKANLDNTIALCELLDNPQHSFRSIHVTGTNGKGSVSHMLASILQTAGFRTGLYTSPHLKDFRERIRVNGKMVSKKYVGSFVQKYRKQFEPFKPSFFELTVGMAFEYFREQQVDIAVVEVGLGGRLDSTNILTPVLSVITNVSFDHMQFLGDTLEKIASEKAGIIKPGIPVVIGETQEEVRTVFQQKAIECNSDILWADQHFHAGNFILKGKGATRLLMDISRDGVPYLNQLISPLSGSYQRKNILTVLGVCDQLIEQRFSLTPGLIRKGIQDTIKNTSLKGRWQIRRKCQIPRRVIEIHNPCPIYVSGHTSIVLQRKQSYKAALFIYRFTRGRRSVTSTSLSARFGRFTSTIRPNRSKEIEPAQQVPSLT